MLFPYAVQILDLYHELDKMAEDIGSSAELAGLAKECAGCYGHHRRRTVYRRYRHELLDTTVGTMHFSPQHD